MTEEEAVGLGSELAKALREVMQAHGVEEAVVLVTKGTASMTYLYPGCPPTCQEPELCAAKSMELTAAFLEDRVDELLQHHRETSDNNITKH